MSRIILNRYDNGSPHVVVGWDHPASGAFWQEYATQEEIADAERRLAIGVPYRSDDMVYETGVKREGGTWPGIPLDKFKAEVPEDLRPLITDPVMEMLHQHAEDLNSGYTGAAHGGMYDLTGGSSQ